MFCSNCGESADPAAQFCSKCGASVKPPLPAIAASGTSSPVQGALTSDQARPWVRYWARTFDVYSFSLVAGVILGVVAPQFLAEQNEYALGMMLVFAWVFIEALLLSSFQTTPGKWLFRTNIALSSGTPISYSQALTRSLKVWWRGFGTGFPIAALITMIVAHGRLSRNGITSWDKDGGFKITHGVIGVPRVLAAIAFFFVFLVVISIGNSA